MKTNWTKYFALTKNNLPSKSLVAALKYLKNKDVAYDLGAGALKDTKFLRKHFRIVLAVDKNPFDLTVIKKDLKDLKFLTKADLINFQYSLPFIKPKNFLKVWSRMVNSLTPGGIFVGQLFGVDDAWNDGRDMTFLSSKEVNNLIKRFKVIKFKEFKGVRKLANGTPKYWHVYDLILKKPL